MKPNHIKAKPQAKAATEPSPYLSLPLVVRQTRERYYGELTGKDYFTAEIMWPFESNSAVHIEAAHKTMSVLGRSTLSPADAVADWTRRAMLDGHRVCGVQVRLTKGRP